MWLGCCGLYLQPSEPLKLLLVVYLAAYLADQQAFLRARAIGFGDQKPEPLLPLLAPTLILTGVALLLLAVQRDLGTASIFLFLYTVIVYLASRRKLILAIGAGVLFGAGVAGTLMFDLVRVRVDAWLNPWLDPSGRSYQIVQSLLAIANGGLLGRGPGMGNPTLVPVAHSDFIFSAIAEETGLIGVFALLALLALIAQRGFRIALRAPDTYRRLLAAGLTTFIVAQGVLIMGGNARLMPLTGVTLPFVSYGGSSLVTSSLAILLLLLISGQPQSRLEEPLDPGPYLRLNVFLMAGLAGIALICGWWAVIRAPALLARTDNARRTIADRNVQRGAILDRSNDPINNSIGQPGNYTRQTEYYPLGPVVGYTHPVYGQAGLEASLDPILRGLSGNPSLLIWWNHLLYGEPPPGLDIRLSLDLSLQAFADQQLDGHAGSLVVINTTTGEILAMASHPTFDPNQLEENWASLIDDPTAPLLNRATLGRYQPGTALGPFILAMAQQEGALPALPQTQEFILGEWIVNCAVPFQDSGWADLIASGCPAAQVTLATNLGPKNLLDLYMRLGFYSAPNIRLPVDAAPSPQSLENLEGAALGQVDISVTPLQMALAAASLSGSGSLPAPQLVTAFRNAQGIWEIMPPGGEPVQALPAASADRTALALALDGEDIWQSLAVSPNGSDQTISWYIGGSLPEGDSSGLNLAIAVVLEEDNAALVQEIGHNVLLEGLMP
jgi:cell division protein FtsW (lipid II flippase)